MYVATVPNRNSPPAFLLRESFRLHGKVKNRTLANLSHWPPHQIEALRCVFKNDLAALSEPLPQAFSITRSLPHGHVAAVVATLEKLGLPRLLDRQASRRRTLALALVASQVIEPVSKLATARALNPPTAHHSLGTRLGLGTVHDDELYRAMDWLVERQPQIEQALAKRHLGAGRLVLYDLTSTYFEGRHCPLAQFGHSRDERRGNPQIVVGLVASEEGCPVAAEVFAGNTADPNTLAVQLEKLRGRFHLKELVLVGDRGALTAKRIENELKPLEGVGWITALRAPQIRELLAGGGLQLSLFDERDLAEIESADYPGERLVACRNPLLEEERGRKRDELLAATEKKLAAIQQATRRKVRPLRSPHLISYKVGRALGPSKVAKYFRWRLGAEGLEYERHEAAIQRDRELDGIYVIRTSLPKERATAEEAVLSYKRLAEAERAFRTLKGLELQLRPVRHRKEQRVRAHVLLCLLAYYVEWHWRRALAPLLFEDEQRGERRGSVVAPAERSEAAKRKAARRQTEEGLPVQSYRDWLRDLATIAQNQVEPKDPQVPAFEMTTRPTAGQQRALELLGVKL